MEENVFDLCAWRARRPPATPPPQVYAEVQLARRLYDALAAQGYELRFDRAEDGSAVRAELRTLDGDRVRDVSLLEAVGADEPGDPMPPAA